MERVVNNYLFGKACLQCEVSVRIVVNYSFAIHDTFNQNCLIISALDPIFSGFNRFRMDLKMMLGPDRLFKCMFWPYWLPNWIFITPCLLLVSHSTLNI